MTRTTRTPLPSLLAPALATPAVSVALAAAAVRTDFDTLAPARPVELRALTTAGPDTVSDIWTHILPAL